MRIPLSAPHTGDQEFPARNLDADRTSSEAAGRGTRLVSLLRPILQDVLAFRVDALPGVRHEPGAAT